MIKYYKQVKTRSWHRKIKLQSSFQNLAGALSQMASIDGHAKPGLSSVNSRPKFSPVLGSMRWMMWVHDSEAITIRNVLRKIHHSSCHFLNMYEKMKRHAKTIANAWTRRQKNRMMQIMATASIWHKHSERNYLSTNWRNIHKLNATMRMTINKVWLKNQINNIGASGDGQNLMCEIKSCKENLPSKVKLLDEKFYR